jgi:hypothetical protein
LLIITRIIIIVRFGCRAIGTVLAVALLTLCFAPRARGQPARDACWIRGNPGDVAVRASEHDSASLALDGAMIKVCYGRPGRHHRQIMGQLVPYGTAWRLGADEATAIHVSFPARIAGVNVAPGWYSLYAIPEPKQWRIIVNGDAQRWGIPINDAVRAKDVGDGVVSAEHLANPVDVLTITLRGTSNSTATLDVEWENTRIRIPVERR